MGSLEIPSRPAKYQGGPFHLSIGGWRDVADTFEAVPRQSNGKGREAIGRLKASSWELDNVLRFVSGMILKSSLEERVLQTRQQILTWSQVEHEALP